MVYFYQKDKNAIQTAKDVYSLRKFHSSYDLKNILVNLH